MSDLSVESTFHLLNAAAKGDIDTIKNIILSGIDINIPDVKGRTALMAAAFKGQIESVKYLVQSGAKIDLISTDGLTAIDLARKSGKTEIVRYLESGNDTDKLFEIPGNAKLFIDSTSTNNEPVKHIPSKKFIYFGLILILIVVSFIGYYFFDNDVKKQPKMTFKNKKIKATVEENKAVKITTPEDKGILPLSEQNKNKLLINLGGGVMLEMIKIPAGTFQMGSPSREKERDDGREDPLHLVTITLDFFMGKYEITQGQWTMIMGSNPSNFKSGDNYPVEMVSWNDCQNFINKLNTNYSNYGTFRLPTEAEWEYACRAGQSASFYWGDESMDNYVWYASNSNLKTHPVGQKLPNVFGLHDMSGNVWEWCDDWYKSYKPGVIAFNANSYRVIRGGGCSSYPRDCRSALRYDNVPSKCGDSLGFRLALSPNQ